MDDIRLDGSRSNRIPNLGKIHKQMKKIILSILLIAYAIISTATIGCNAHDPSDVVGVAILTPCWLIFGVYYLRLIWRKKKVTGADMLLLPMLQIIGIHKNYTDSDRDKTMLAKTTIPFLLSFAICPILISLMSIVFAYCYDSEGVVFAINLIHLLILFIIPITLIAGIILAAKQDWLNKSKQN